MLKRKLKILGMIMAGILAAGVCTGCGTNPEASPEGSGNADSSGGETLTIAFSQCGNQNNWKVTQTNDMKAKIEAAGYNYIYTDAGDDTAQQVSDIEDLIAQKPDYLIVSPREADGFNEVLQEAMNADIPVILVDRGIHGEVGVDYTCLNSSDLVWEGQQCALALEKDFEGQKCNVVEISGTPGGSSTIDRNKGFMDEIKGNDNVNVLASQVGNFDRAEAQEAMENLIQAYGDEINAVYAHNDDNAIGAIQAIKAAGIETGKIKVYSMDGQKDALQAIIDGDMTMTVLCQPRFGDSVLSIIDRLESGEDVGGFVVNEDKIYDAGNAEECLDEAY